MSYYSHDELQVLDEIRELKAVVASGGKTAEGVKLTVTDAMSMPNAPLVFRRVITEVVQEAIEPTLIASRLLDRIEYDGYGSTITFGTVGSMGTMNLDMAEGGEYPEYTVPATGQGNMHVNIGKTGIAIKITEEMLKYSQWDLIALHMRQAGYALARHKERKVFNMLNKIGFKTFDNLAPATAEIGRTSGRNITGAGNGSMTVDDLFDMYAKSMERGYTPDVVLVHPLSWATFIKDPVMREMNLNFGGGGWWNGTPKNVAPSLSSIWKQLGRTGKPTSNPSREEREGTQESIISMPYKFPFGNLTIIPSHNVPFDPINKTTSIIMLDSKELGALVVAEDPTTEEWVDMARDIRKVKIRERYGIALYNEGNSVSVAQNISIEPNALALPPTAMVTGLPEIIRK
jgi:hypothetical protein